MVIIAPGMAASVLCMWSSVLIVSVFSQLKGYRTLDCGVKPSRGLEGDGCGKELSNDRLYEKCRRKRYEILEFRLGQSDG